MLSDRSVMPSAILGYCFGEYSASIVAGILTLEIAVDILVHRARSLRNVTGAMLNAFCDSSSIRRVLSCMLSPPSIAIYAGPKHIVLSGNSTQIDNARHMLEVESIKTLPVNTAEIDAAAMNFPPISYAVKNSVVPYISCLTGNVLQGKMREPVRFLQATELTRTAFPTSAFVDIGPNKILTKTVSYFGWSGTTVFTLDAHMFIVDGPAAGRALHHVNRTPDSKETTKGDALQTAVELLADMFGFTQTDPAVLLACNPWILYDFQKHLDHEPES
ncbi:hypothetical protein B0H17DRAFT_1199340 [Mycena rosella]|uniref:Malonyl-CoA:ACP transacylase (MAT) domain-containing protein n=1 Tax=Mycena rosella TaxID=1033263 RepID=A0AAD7GL22_MYCRO|nr:hypothetical protein B0H17DRAFT_1199340 [Mycena rosella]